MISFNYYFFLGAYYNMSEIHLNKFENHLLSIKTESQKMIHPNSHPTYNERHKKFHSGSVE